MSRGSIGSTAWENSIPNPNEGDMPIDLPTMETQDFIQIIQEQMGKRNEFIDNLSHPS